MHVALLLLLCSTAVHTGVSQTLPTILPRTETVAPPVQRCTLDDQIAFISALPNAEECGLSLQTVFTPPANDSMALNKALKSVCTNNCGGIYASFLQTTCNDEVGAETLRIHCTPTNRSAAVGPYCSYAIGGFINESMFNNLYLCNESDVCSPGCRKALENFKTQVGCCYQNAYNNSVYNQQLFDAGFITPNEFVALQKLNNPVGSPWSLCDIKPPQRCGPPSIMPPAPPKCKLEDQISFISSLPNAAVCGPSIATVFQPPANNTMALRRALVDVCTNDCGGVYSNFLKSTCNDQFGAESLRIYCTPTNGSAAAGNYCRSAAGDILNSTLFDDLNSCYNGTVDSPCTDGCREALLRLKRQTGCCYQNVYNNTMYNRELLNAGFITPSEFSGLQQLNDPYFSPWTFCEIKPPRRCGAPIFRPPPPPRCTLIDQIAFLSSTPNIDATVCGLSIATVFQSPANNNMALRRALANACTNDCGGVYSKFLESTCNDRIGSESLRIYCTPTNGSTTVGNYCRFAAGDILNPTLFDDLNLCSKGTVDSPCPDDCREALLRLKRQTGCCYQNIYNNTAYYRELLNAGFVTPTQFTGLQKLNNPGVNQWTLCGIEPPRRCGTPTIKPPASPNCTLDDQISFLTSLPNAAVCGQGIATALGPTPSNPTVLTKALMDVCTRDCAGAYSNFLRSTCNDWFAAENLRVLCVSTNKSDIATPGPYCRFATDIDISYFDTFPCQNSSSGTSCAPECRSALLRIKADVGCCYQELYNNTLYSREQLLAGFLPPVVFTELQLLNNPVTNPWKVCNVTPPTSCTQQPRPDDCPRGTYRRNRTCVQCPANTNIMLSGGDATVCPCINGFFRGNREGPSERCSAPPSACRNIQALQRTATQITLRWRKPMSIGRNDFYYQIRYSDGDTTGQHSIQSSFDYIQEVVSGLKPDSSYRFTVTVNNGVSDQDTRDDRLRSCELMTRTMEGRPSPPRDVQSFCSVVAWRMPRNPNGRITGYDVRLNRPWSGDIMSVGNDGTFLAVEEEYQQSDILVQVRAKTRAGAGNWSEQISLGCENTPIGTCPPCECPSTSEPLQGIHFTLGDQVYGNNSVVSLSSIGEGDGALICRTDNTLCCGTLPNRFGQFYYPSGAQVPVNSAGQGFYRNRGDQLIRLNQRAGADSPTGRYRCEIPDANRDVQSIYITLV